MHPKAVTGKHVIKGTLVVVVLVVVTKTSKKGLEHKVFILTKGVKGKITFLFSLPFLMVFDVGTDGKNIQGRFTAFIEKSVRKCPCPCLSSSV